MIVSLAIMVGPALAIFFVGIVALVIIAALAIVVGDLIMAIASLVMVSRSALAIPPGAILCVLVLSGLRLPCVVDNLLCLQPLGNLPLGEGLEVFVVDSVWGLVA